MKWRIYYEDGSYSDDLSRPYGVLCILQEDRFTGRRTIRGFDYYLLIDHGWLGMGYDGMMYYITHKLRHVQAVMVGVMVDPDIFQHVYTIAKNDFDFPLQTAERSMEHPVESEGSV